MLQCLVYIVQNVTITTKSPNGHVDLVLWLPKDRYLSNLTYFTNFATRTTIQQSTFMERTMYCVLFMVKNVTG